MLWCREHWIAVLTEGYWCWSMRDWNDFTKTGDMGDSWGYQEVTDLVLCASWRLGQDFGRVALFVLPIPQAWCDSSWPYLCSDGSLNASVCKLIYATWALGFTKWICLQSPTICNVCLRWPSWFSPEVDFGDVWRHFWLWWQVGDRERGVESRGAAKHPAMYRMTPTENYQAPNVPDAEVEKLHFTLEVVNSQLPLLVSGSGGL